MISTALRQTTFATGRRFQSTKVCTAFLTAKNKSFSESWLQDPGTYPMMVIMGAAGLLVVGASASCLTFCPDVQIDTKKRNSTLRYWGQ